jgi:hypothetical protein
MITGSMSDDLIALSETKSFDHRSFDHRFKRAPIRGHTP